MSYAPKSDESVHGMMPTSEVKHKYENLDGLRGVAALCVVMFHIAELVTPDTDHNPFRHTHLAVDFFFVLSGFVISHAYGDRLRRRPSEAGHLDFRDFVITRLIRLHPLAIFGMILGLANYLFDPFVAGAKASAGLIATAFMLGMLVLPQPVLPNRFGDTHGLNSPAWSLFQEYIGSFLYGLVGYRASNRALAVFCALSGAAMLATSLHFNGLSVGWDWERFWAAFVRLLYPFAAGVLLHRLRPRMSIPRSSLVLPIALIAFFMAPPFKALDGAFEAATVLLAWPLLVVLGANAPNLCGRTRSIYAWLGRISYPIYIIHYPFMCTFAHWKWGGNRSQQQVLAVEAGLYAGLIALAWACLCFYDEPLRLRLAATLRKHRRVSGGHHHRLQEPIGYVPPAEAEQTTLG
jgi:peptidoglycan/LPS O-acetylase OafA/YrhL